MLRGLLLGHHPPPHLHRTLSVRLGRCRLHLCARCLGAALGVGAALGLLLLPVRPAPALALCLGALLPLPAIADFHTQLLGRRESTHPLRLATGFLCGYAGGLAAASALRAPWALAGLAVIPAYLAALYASRSCRPALAAHLRLYADYCLDGCPGADRERMQAALSALAAPE